MDVIELVTMDWTTLPSRSALESGLHVPRCLSFLENRENKEVFFARLKNKKIGLINVSEFYLTDKLKAKDCVEKLFSFIENGLFYYKKATGIWSEALLFLIKQGVYDWSPHIVKQFLEEPDSKKFLKQFYAHSTKLIVPPLDAISYISKPTKSSISPTKKEPPTKIIPSPKKSMGNVYQLNSKSLQHTPLPELTFIDI